MSVTELKGSVGPAFRGPPTVEHLPTGSLRPNPRNSRTHSKKQIGLIKQSIDKFGQIKPVIVDDKDAVF